MLFEIKEVKHEQELLSFLWNDVGGFYNVYKDGQHLYEGTVPEFQDDQFIRGKFHEYMIERVVRNEVIDVIVMQTSAFHNEKNSDHPLQSLVLTTIVAKTQIALSWEHIHGIHEYEIYRDGKLKGRVKTNRFIDRDIKNDSTYVYTIRCTRTIRDSKEKLNVTKTLLSSMFDRLNPVRQQSSGRETFTNIKWIGRLDHLLLPMNERLSRKKIERWKFRYTTFLADQWVKNPNPLSLNHFFKGDHRSFDPNGETFRTRVDVELAYDLARDPLVFSKKIGPSMAYSRRKIFRKQATASLEGIQLKRIDRQRGESGFLLTHAVGNPLTTAPDMDYKVNATFHRNGMFDLYGRFDPAPHHELYIARGEEEWQPVMQVRSRGIAFLSNVIACHYWRCSNFE